MTLATVIDGVVATLGAMTGIERAYADPPESIAQFPALLAFAGNGEMTVVSGGLGKSLHTIVVEIHHSRTIIQEAIDAAKVWPDRVLQALYDDQAAPSSALGGVVWPVLYEAAPLAYNQETHYGVRFRITIKAMDAL